MIVLYLAGVGIYYCENEAQPEVFSSIFHSLWWAVATLTTVGYGTGALLGRGVKHVRAVHWREELGLAQAMWVIEVENFGPFIVESDLAGNSLFERENAKISANLAAAYAGTKPAVLKRFGETDDRTDELIG